MNFFKKIIVGFLFSLVFFGTTNAGYLPGSWDSGIEKVELQHVKETAEIKTGTDKIIYYLTKSVIPFVKYLMLTLSITFILLYLFSALFEEGDEGKENVKKKIYYSLFGFILISISAEIPNIINSDLIKEGKILKIEGLKSVSMLIYDYLKIIIYAFATFIIVISGIKIINGKDEGEVDKEKLTVLYSIFGIILLFVAERFVYGIFFKDLDNPTLNQNAGVESASEIVGIISFFMKYAAIAAIIFIILGGFYYIFSLGEEDGETKGKTVVKNAVIGLFIIMSSYTILKTFLPGL